MKIEYVRIGELIPFAKNVRCHSDDQIDLIADSIKRYGFNNPILCDDENCVIAGHGRLLAAQKIYLEQVPVIYLSHLSDIEKRAYMLADNQLAVMSTWDDELLKQELSFLSFDGVNVEWLGFESLDSGLAFEDNDTDKDTDLKSGKGDKGNTQDVIFCPKCGCSFELGS